MSDLVADIAQILADQKDLQQDTVQADGEVFKSEQSQLKPVNWRLASKSRLAESTSLKKRLRCRGPTRDASPRQKST